MLPDNLGRKTKLTFQILFVEQETTTGAFLNGPKQIEARIVENNR